MIRMLTLLIAVIALHGAPVAAETIQINCMKRPDILQIVEGQFGQRQRSRGLNTKLSSPFVLETWASEENGTWSILTTKADGITCIIFYGTQWQDMTQ